MVAGKSFDSAMLDEPSQARAYVSPGRINLIAWVLRALCCSEPEEPALVDSVYGYGYAGILSST